MKTKILIVIFLQLSIPFLQGQDYVYAPFVEDGMLWSYAFIRQVGITDFKADYSIYHLQGDTVIDGLNYKKLFSDCSENYIAALREENKKIFIVKAQEEEKLLYDFNLQEGDWVGYSHQVTKIDTILIGNTKRKRFVFDSGYETWIEGIGSLEDFYPLRGRLLGYEEQGINYQKKGAELVYKTDKWYFNENDCNPVPSQTMKLLDENNLWSVLEKDNSPPGFPDTNPYKLSHWLKTGNDTILNGKTYKTMLYSMDENHSTWEDRGFFLREEEGKVYWLNIDETREEETLLYDFNLQEGDSISRYLAPLWNIKIVSAVDSIRYIQIGNSLRKTFYISNTLDSGWWKIPEIWIEGIGSLWGLERNNICSFVTGCQVIRNLLCFYQNGEELYHSPDFDNCYYHWTWLGIEKPELIPDFQIYPNPSSGKFTITTTHGDENSQIQIFDSSGKQIRSFRIGSSNHIEVDMSDVPSGVYFVKSILQNGNTKTLKFIKR